MRTGRAADNGNFILAEIEVSAAPLDVSKDASQKAHPVPLKAAWADFSQESWHVSGAIDGDPKTGWAVALKQKKKKDENTEKYLVPVWANGRSKEAIFEFAEPLPFPQGAALTITLRQAAGSQGHNLGRFRLSVTAP